MKKIYLLALLCTCFSLSIFADGVEIDGIYYVLDSTNYTASVTYTGSSYSSSNSYSGDVLIPSFMDYNNKTYNVIKIGTYAFYGCSSLTSVTIPNSVISIGYEAFYKCSALTSIEIPNSVTSIGYAAFRYCSSLTSVTIPNSVTSIGNSAFDDCSSLPVINNIRYADIYLVEAVDKKISTCIIKDGTKFIGSGAFMACDRLISVGIPNSVTSIGTSAFYKSTGLTSVTIGDGVTSIGENAFQYCSGLISMSIGNNVTSIGNWAFGNCSGLTSVTIPNSVTSIGENAFALCDNLVSYNVDANNPNYCSIDGVLLNRDQTTLMQYPTGRQGKYTIPNSVTSIGENAFYCRRGLTSVTIPNSVTSIGEWAFYGCNVLITVSIGNSVTSIGEKAFHYCNSLAYVYCEPSIPPLVSPSVLSSSLFYQISDSAILYVPYESVELYKADATYVNSFAEIRGMIFGESEVDSITSTTATLKWLPDSAVTQYDINVYTADTLFAHYVVDGNGQIISSQRFAPSIYHQKLDTTVSSTEYFVISLDGLSAETNYTYTIDGTNAQSAPIYHEEGSFTTLNDNEEGFLDAISNEERKPCKILRNGQIYIIRGDKTYTIQGQEVK